MSYDIDDICCYNTTEKWVDTEADETEEVKKAPPPTDSVLARNSPLPTPTSAPVTPAAVANPSVSASAPMMTSAAGSAGNLYSLKRRQGSKYVDVVGESHHSDIISFSECDWLITSICSRDWPITRTWSCDWLIVSTCSLDWLITVYLHTLFSSTCTS